MKRELQGRYITSSTAGETVRAFAPHPLSPRPPIEWTPGLRDKFDQEPGVPLDDVREVLNYTAALVHGLKRLEEGFPPSLRLIREIHGVLLAKGRGWNQAPGEFRRSQNWIGGSRPGNASFVPPPPEEVPECMGKLELFLNDRPKPTSVLVKAALAHVQFETIHPFPDGNGRLGRLLITPILCEQKVLREPMLYLSPISRPTASTITICQTTCVSRAIGRHGSTSSPTRSSRPAPRRWRRPAAS